MAVQTQIQTAPFGAIAAFRFVSSLEAATQSVAAWHAARKTEKELYALSPRQLDDLGISRSDIPSLAARKAR